MGVVQRFVKSFLREQWRSKITDAPRPPCTQGHVRIQNLSTHAALQRHEGVPKHVVRGRRQDGDRFPLDGMDEVDASGMQVNRRVVIGAARAVFHVAFDGTSELGHGGADLMVPSCFWEHLHKRVVVRLALELVHQLAFLAVVSRLVVGEALVELVVFGQKVDHVALRLGRRWLDHRPIRLLHFAVAEHRAQALVGLAGSGVQNHPRDRPVQPVDGPDVRLAWLVVLLGNVKDVLLLNQVPVPHRKKLDLR